MTRREGSALRLRAGDWVEVRPAEEILATVDDRGRVDGLPFMPEMLPFCGRRFRVHKSAHKTCDTIKGYKARGMRSAVHLEGLRCDGEAHDGCQAGCLLFWKDAWLRRARGVESAQDPGVETRPEHENEPTGTPSLAARGTPRCDLEELARATRAPAPEDDSADPAAEYFSCQATELVRATTPLRWWDPRHYLKDLATRNVGFGTFLRVMTVAAFNLVMHMHWRGRPYPYIRGLAGEKTPTETLNLQPGELVRVRSKGEIMATINKRQRNRGLWFDAEMVPYCGRTFRVLRRVERIINEQTGAMMRLPGACLILDGVTCRGHLSRGRLFCPRNVYAYWREIWLKRVE